MSVVVALLDSGVNADHPHIRGQGELRFGPTVGDDGVLTDRGEHTDAIGHGTAAGAAILDLAPGAALYSVKLFDQRPDCPFEHVLTALDHVLDERPNLINLSLGTPRMEWLEPLTERVDRCAALGIMLVAPASFSGLPCYPGAIQGVDGVVADANVPRDRPEQRESAGRTWWHASPYPRDLPGVPRDANLHGASMATANVTGFLAAQRASGG